MARHFEELFTGVRDADVRAARALKFPNASGRPVPLAAPGAVGPQLPPRTRTGADAPFARLIFPPRIEKLATSRDFQAAERTLTLAAGVGATVAGPSFQVPQGQVGWLQYTDLYLLTPTALTLVSLGVFINGGPVPGFSAIQNYPGIGNFVVIGEEDMRVRIPAGALVTTLITNLNANGPWTVGGTIQGWFHPEADELRVWDADI